MVSRLLTVSVPTILLAIPALAYVAAPKTAFADTEITLVSATTPGITCAIVAYDCPEPQAVQVYVDSTLVMDYVANSDALTAPTAPCFDESQFGAGSHTIVAEGTCAGVETSGSVITSFANPPLKLDNVEVVEFSHSIGDTIAVVLQAPASGLDIAVDFGAVDTDYLPGDEVVTDIGGGQYHVEYTLSSANMTDAGIYALPVEISDGADTRTHWDAVTVRYTPAPTGVVAFQDSVGADFIIGDLPAGTSSTITPSTGTFRFQSQPGGQALLTGTITTSTNMDGKAVLVNVREAGTGGYASSEVWIQNSTCSPASPTCTANISLPLRIRPAHFDDVNDGDQVSLEIGFGTFAGGGPVYTPTSTLPNQWTISGKAPPNSTDMRGSLTYQRIKQIGQSDPNNELHPLYGSLSLEYETMPLRRVTMEILDSCGHVYTAITSESGTWQRYVPKECPGNHNYTLRAKPHAGNGVYRVISRGFNGLTHHSVIGTVNVPNNVLQQNWGNRNYHSTFSEYGEFSTFMAGVRIQEWARPYLLGDAQVGAFPWLYFKFDLNQQGSGGCAGTSCYGSQVVTVCGMPSNPDHKDEFTLAHETFHWFQDMFMADLAGNTSGGTYAWAGAFGEGFATMMQGELLGVVWRAQMFNTNATEAERLDFQGSARQAGGEGGDWVMALPLNLYTVTGDQGSGGWSWRILWDFFDDAPNEPGTEFTRYDTALGVSTPNPTFTDYGAGFDVVGASWKFNDVIVKYLGGNYMPANPSRPDIDTRGAPGLDMTEFLDGVLCRNREEWDDMEIIVHEMMDFQAYSPSFAPASCP